MLAGSQVCILMEDDPEEGGCGSVPYSVATTLGIGENPTCDLVVSHLLHIAEMYPYEEVNETVKLWVAPACEQIYGYFNHLLSQRQISADDLEKLSDTRCVWTGRTFILPSSIAKSWNRQGPHLYGIPYTLASKGNFTAALNVQGEFTLDHFLAALKQISIECDGKPIPHDRDDFKTISEISSVLASQTSSEIVLSEHRVCYLPDMDKIMHKTSELAYNDAPWCEIDQESFYVHQIVHRHVALQLGVTSVRSKAIQPYLRTPVNQQLPSEARGKPFGQHEDLKQRIRNILCEYPRDITVLKELLQNADDAKATKMYVILDKRKHGTKKLLSAEWQDLQGPALLVWNDTGMDEKDLKGIQELGLGSKRFNEDTIGQFGIGFNVVYHLTDCPSFCTNGDTLCVLDPHCRYVEGADECRPGRQFDRIDDKFWHNFSDMKSTYLRDTDERFNCPRDIQERGTLFRFPLRHSNKLVSKSELVTKDEASIFGSSHKPLSCLLYTSPSPRDATLSRMPSSA